MSTYACQSRDMNDTFSSTYFNIKVSKKAIKKRRHIILVIGSTLGASRPTSPSTHYTIVVKLRKTCIYKLLSTWHSLVGRVFWEEEIFKIYMQEKKLLKLFKWIIESISKST